ncbi:MAG: hypothetical protein GY719_25705 [bacterium]|nr:hypothetical protein [bacterium]
MNLTDEQYHAAARQRRDLERPYDRAEHKKVRAERLVVQAETDAASVTPQAADLAAQQAGAGAVGIRAAFIADLTLAIRNLEEIRGKLADDCRENGADYTQKQEGKFEGGFLMVRGVLMDWLEPMLREWTHGRHSSRKGEEIQAAAARLLAERPRSTP